MKINNAKVSYTIWDQKSLTEHSHADPRNEQAGVHRSSRTPSPRQVGLRAGRSALHCAVLFHPAGGEPLQFFNRGAEDRVDAEQPARMRRSGRSGITTKMV